MARKNPSEVIESLLKQPDPAKTEGLLRALRGRLVLSEDAMDQLRSIQKARIDEAQAKDDLKSARAAERDAVNKLLELRDKWADQTDLMTLADSESTFAQAKSDLPGEVSLLLFGPASALKEALADVPANEWAIKQAAAFADEHGAEQGRFDTGRVSKLRAALASQIQSGIPDKVEDGKKVAARKKPLSRTTEQTAAAL